MFGKLGKKFITRSPSYIGSWKSGSPHLKGTQKEGIDHETIICESVIKGEASQSNNALTTKETCYKNDASVTEVNVLSQTLSKTEKKQVQFYAWKDKDPEVTPKDIDQFIIRRKATEEEDQNFQKSKLGQGNSNYKKEGSSNHRYKKIANPKDES